MHYLFIIYLLFIYYLFIIYLLFIYYLSTITVSRN